MLFSTSAYSRNLGGLNDQIAPTTVRRKLILNARHAPPDSSSAYRVLLIKSRGGVAGRAGASCRFLIGFCRFRFFALHRAVVALSRWWRIPGTRAIHAILGHVHTFWLDSHHHNSMSFRHPMAMPSSLFANDRASRCSQPQAYCRRSIGNG